MSATWKLVIAALVAQALASVAPVAGEKAEDYKTELKAWVKKTGTVAVTRWRIFGIPIRIRVGVGADIRSFLICEIDKVTADTVTDLIRKLSSAYT
ncbi:MAG TPA: hypothetical protein VGM37_09385 [Armatimonadota bacterium]|jgi:hypothetical protein